MNVQEGLKAAMRCKLGELPKLAESRPPPNAWPYLNSHTAVALALQGGQAVEEQLLGNLTPGKVTNNLSDIAVGRVGSQAGRASPTY